jgi:hypothetical protein
MMKSFLLQFYYFAAIDEVTVASNNFLVLFKQINRLSASENFGS